MKLNEAKSGYIGTITSIDGDTRFLSRITSIGLTQGCQLVNHYTISCLVLICLPF